MLIAVTRHPDGSQSSRIWALPADRIDATVVGLGEPDAHTHVPAAARAGARDALAEVTAQSIIVRRTPGRIDP